MNYFWNGNGFLLFFNKNYEKSILFMKTMRGSVFYIKN